jgi:hypothetical protein
VVPRPGSRLAVVPADEANVGSAGYVAGHPAADITG